jgi:hypothetical protein
MVYMHIPIDNRIYILYNAYTNILKPQGEYMSKQPPTSPKSVHTEPPKCECKGDCGLACKCFKPCNKSLVDEPEKFKAWDHELPNQENIGELCDSIREESRMATEDELEELIEHKEGSRKATVFDQVAFFAARVNNFLMLQSFKGDDVLMAAELMKEATEIYKELK